MSEYTFPMDVVVRQTEEAAKADMDYYDDDALDEESIDPVGIEIGNSMESVEVESMEHLHEVMREYGSDYVIDDCELAEYYNSWLEFHGE